MRINGGLVLFVIPIIALLMFGVSISWDRFRRSTRLLPAR